MITPVQGITAVKQSGANPFPEKDAESDRNAAAEICWTAIVMVTNGTNTAFYYQ